MAEIIPLPEQSPEKKPDGGEGCEHGGINLTTVARPGDPSARAGARCDAGTDQYFAGAGNNPVERSGSVNYGDAPASQVTLNPGDTFWQLAGQKYNGQYPIEAIYAANGMKPGVTSESNGQLQFEDPTYYAGKTYTLPAAKDVPSLIDQYHQQVEQEGGYGARRLGSADQTTNVKLIYGDTFWNLAEHKYGQSDHPPIEAIYMANNLMPPVHPDGNGKITLGDPTYYAGQSYVLPASNEVPQLEREFWNKIGHPELCPPQYQLAGAGDSGPSPAGNPNPNPGDNYRQYGGTSMGPDGQTPNEHAWEEGYRQAYRDAWHDEQQQGGAVNTQEENYRMAQYQTFGPNGPYGTAPGPEGGPMWNGAPAPGPEGGPMWNGAPGPAPGMPTGPGYWEGQPPGTAMPPGGTGWYGYTGDIGPFASPAASMPNGGGAYNPEFANGQPGYSQYGDVPAGLSANGAPPNVAAAAYQESEAPPPPGGYGANDPNLQAAISQATQFYTGNGGTRPSFYVAGGQYDNGQPSMGIYDPNKISPISSPGDWMTQGGDLPASGPGGSEEEGVAPPSVVTKPQGQG